MAADINVRELAALVRAKRAGRGLRAIAQEIGSISAATLSRVEQGKTPDLDTLAALCNWLGVSPDLFIAGTGYADVNGPDAIAHAPGLSTPQVIAAHLRADESLPEGAASALAEMMRLAYQVAKGGDSNRVSSNESTR
jgi:transcriptional regulator with XRE-family HTH domain